MLEAYNIITLGAKWAGSKRWQILQKENRHTHLNFGKEFVGLSIRHFDWFWEMVIPLRANRVGEFIEIRQKKIHPSVFWVPLGVCHSVTLWLCNSVANKPPLISAACHGIGQKKNLGLIGQKSLSQKFYWKHFNNIIPLCSTIFKSLQVRLLSPISLLNIFFWLINYPDSHYSQGGLEICHTNFPST